MCKVLVFGGRQWGEVDFIHAHKTTPVAKFMERRAFKQKVLLVTALSAFHHEMQVSFVVHGAAKGADTLAGRWAKEFGIPAKPYPADWKTYGSQAGIIRNQLMLDDNPDLQFAIGFPGADGTQDMWKRIHIRNIPYLNIVEDDPRWPIQVP